MTQAELDKIWDAALAKQNTGWVPMDHGEIHTLKRQAPPQDLWEHKAPNGEWREVPPMAARHA